MANFRLYYDSEVLKMKVGVNVILPESTWGTSLADRPRDYRYPVLWLQSGGGFDYTDWQRYTSLELYASEVGIAVVCSGTYCSGYMDTVHGDFKYFSQLSIETPRVVRHLFPLSEKPEENFLAGFSMGGYGSTGSSQTQLYSLDGDVLLTVTPLDTMTVTIAVDEKDIADIKTGMTAQLTMNALPDETFEGQVTRVAQTGSGNGGSSKFDVEITLSRESDMLPGMSTTAQLTLYEKMDVLTLPVAALRDEGGKTLVYTGKDKKTGEPANPVEVTTGLSDGENVEILSGIDSGTTVYYSYYDTVTESDAVETERSMF